MTKPSWYQSSVKRTEPLSDMVMEESIDWRLNKSGNCTREKATENAYAKSYVPRKPRIRKAVVDRKSCENFN